MVGKSKKMKVSISLEPDDFEFLNELVMSRKAANFSHAVRLCIKGYSDCENTRQITKTGDSSSGDVENGRMQK